jgi:hypothetical protein
MSYFHRTPRPEDGFTKINNAVFKAGMSLEATGLLCWLLHLPDDWIVRDAHLQKTHHIGRDQLRRIILELRVHGFVDVVQQKRLDIRGHKLWDAKVYTVFDMPKLTVPLTGNPSTENPQLTKN